MKTQADHARAYRKRKAAKLQRLAAYEAALQWYAGASNYDCGPGDVIITDYPVMDDRGDIARQALAADRFESGDA